MSQPRYYFCIMVMISIFGAVMFGVGYFFGEAHAPPEIRKFKGDASWSDGITEFIELEHEGEKRTFIYHHGPNGESLSRWDATIHEEN